MYSLLLGPFSGKSKGICVYIYVHVHINMYCSFIDLINMSVVLCKLRWLNPSCTKDKPCDITEHFFVDQTFVE